MGQSLTSVCENPLAICENPEHDQIEEGKTPPLVLRVENDGVVKQLTFSRLDAYKCDAFSRRGQIEKLKKMSKSQGRPRQASPGRTTVNMKGEKVTRTGLMGGSPLGTYAGGATTFGFTEGGGMRGQIWDLYPWREYRFRPKHTFIGKIVGSSVRYLFQVATKLDDRTEEKVQQDLLDNQQTEQYATKFNTQFHDNPEYAGLTPQTIRIVKTQKATIIDSSMKILFRRGEVGILIPLPNEFSFNLNGRGGFGFGGGGFGFNSTSMTGMGTGVTGKGTSTTTGTGGIGGSNRIGNSNSNDPDQEVEKFLFDGSEEYNELAQTFMHYVFYMSNGRDLITDMMGCETEQGLLLLDPVILRAADLVGVVSSAGETRMPSAKLLELFNLLYPRATRISQVFDPQKVAVRGKRQVCGISCSLY